MTSTVIIPASGETQLDIATAACVLKDDVILGGDINILSHQQNGVWLAYYLESAKKLEIAQLSQGHTVVHLYASQLKELNVNIPSVEEQTKIATFLSAVDEKIAQLSHKHELLQQYKQGMLQQLFSQTLRFKDEKGENFPEWEERVLEDVIKFINGKAHESDLDEYGEFTLINSKFISTDGKIFKKVRVYNQRVYDDSLVMVMSDVPNGRALAKVMHIQDGSQFALNQRIGMFVFCKECYPKFFHYQLNRHKYYLAFDSGVGQTNLRKEEVLSCPIFIPCLEEQTKIANFLNAIDNKINVVTNQLQQAREWKQGLLQQMFV